MKIILIGSKGNLGENLAQFLPSDTLQITRANWEELNKINTTEYDALIHLAYDLKNSLSVFPARVIEANLLTTGKLLELAHEKEIKNFFFISSCAVYGNSIDTAEEHPCAPVTANGTIKLLNEQIIERFSLKNGINFKIFRLFNLYGGKDCFSFFYHLQNAIKNDTELTINNNGISQRDFIHVKDAAYIISKLIYEDFPFSTLNIGTGTATKISDIIEAVKKTTPNLKTKHHQCFEAEYSRANTKRLQEIYTHTFTNVFDYIKDNY